MNLDHVWLKRHVRTLLLTAACGVLLLGFGLSASAQASLNVTDYGAAGDAVRFYVSTTSNSPVVSVSGTNRFSNADIGKVIQVFGARKGSWTFITNNQDTLSLITNVTQGTNLWGTMLQTVTTNQALCIVGHNNATNFQNCFAKAHTMVSATVSNVTINIPAGTYLMIDPLTTLNPAWVPAHYADHTPIVYIHSGGLTIAGSGTNTVLMGVGAAVSRLDASGQPGIFRGSLFWIGNSSTNTRYPLVFKDLVMDGGIPQADPRNNLQRTTQWDVTHDAVLYFGNPTQYFERTIFTNVVFQHWCGEMVKNLIGTAGTNVLSIFERCVFFDGSGSGMATSHAHEVRYCRFERLHLMNEWYASVATLPSIIEFNTNLNGGSIAIGGVTTNVQPQSPMLIQSNYLDGGGVMFGNGQNVTVQGNIFTNGLLYVVFTGYPQPGDGTDAISSNIVVRANAFHGDPIVSGAPAVYVTGQPMINIWFTNNTGLSASLVGGFQPTPHTGGPKTNVVFANNIGNKILFCDAGIYSAVDSRNVGDGTYFIDRNNDTFARYADTSGKTNALSYGLGSLHNIIATRPNSVWYLDDSQSRYIPAVAMMVVSNSSGTTGLLYASAKQLNPITMTNGFSAAFLWTNGGWQATFYPSWNPKLRVVGPGP